MRRTLLLFMVLLLAGCSPTPAPAATLTTEPQTATPPPPASTETPTATSAPTETATATPAASFPAADQFTWKQVAAGDLARPLDIQNAGDGSGRLFIVEQAGRIRIIQDGSLLPAPFLDIVAEVGSGGNEQGLLGLAFHPKYKENGTFFVNYTDRNGNTVLARFHVTNDPNIADPASEKHILEVDQPFANHNGGVLAFGPDGYLYAGLGDGGSGGDPFGNAQNTKVLLGKILRLDVDSGNPYAIPRDNPFGNEVWAYGLRNPWRFSFDRLTHDLYIGDVGQNTWEEIDFLPAGSPGGTNFGWNIMEGDHPYSGGEAAGLTPPVASYSHAETGSCSVTGGYVYRGGALPEWQGVYLYGDYCSGLIWGLIHTPAGWQSQILFHSDSRISSFGEDEAGELYVADLSGGIYRLERK